MSSPKSMRVLIAALSASLSAFVAGTCIGWTSPVLPILRSSNSSQSPLDRPITLIEESWIAALLPLGALVSPFLAGPLADSIGRRRVLLSSAIFFMSAFGLTLMAKQVWHILLARFIQGLGISFVLTVLSLYASEIATPETRGAMSSFAQTLIVGGVLYVYVTGAYLSYKSLQWFCFLLPLLFLVSFYFMPESPYYLLSKGQKDDAIKALRFFRQQNRDDLSEEIFQIQSTVEEVQMQHGSLKEVFRKGGNRRALIIGLTLMSIQQISGINVVLFYSQSIFELTKINIKASAASIIMSLFQLISSVCPPLLVDRMGRRKILLFSAGIMSVSLIGLGCFLNAVGHDLIEMGPDMAPTSGFLRLMPITLLVIYIMAYTVGFGPLPWLLMSELFPANIKCYAASLVTASCWILSFICTYTYPLFESVGIYYAFWVYGCYCLFGFYFTFRHLVETKGLTFIEIQQALNS